MPGKSTKIYDTMDIFSSNLRAAKKYDFSNDGASKEYRQINNINKPYKKFFAFNGKPDPDSGSVLLQEIYKQLWTKDILKHCVKGDVIKENSKVYGETLISQNTTLNELYEIVETLEDRKKRKSSGQREISKDYLKKLYQESERKKRGPEKNELENKLSLGTEECVGDMLGIYHTLGNFMPFPCDCNSPRGRGRTRDYFDLMLHIIRQYYYNEGNDGIAEIVGEDKCDDFKNWLDSYVVNDKKTGWKNFIKKNYLQSFVNKRSYPKELWKGHFDDYDNYKELGVYPSKLSQFEEFYKNGYDFITQRTENMIKVLNKDNKKDRSTKFDQK